MSQSRGVGQHSWIRLNCEEDELALALLFFQVSTNYTCSFFADILWRKMDSNPVSLIKNPAFCQFFRVNTMISCMNLVCEERLGKCQLCLPNNSLSAGCKTISRSGQIYIINRTKHLPAWFNPSRPSWYGEVLQYAGMGVYERYNNDGKPVLWIGLRKVGKYSCISMPEKTCSACDLEPDLIHRVLDTEIIMVDGLRAVLISTKPNPLGKVFLRVERKITFISSMANGLIAKLRRTSVDQILTSTCLQVIETASMGNWRLQRCMHMCWILRNCSWIWFVWCLERQDPGWKIPSSGSQCLVTAQVDVLIQDIRNSSLDQYSFDVSAWNKGQSSVSRLESLQSKLCVSTFRTLSTKKKAIVCFYSSHTNYRWAVLVPVLAEILNCDNTSKNFNHI
jgi:hypothetical protein